MKKLSKSQFKPKALEVMRQVEQMPFLLNRDQGEFGALLGHMALANPHWRVFTEEAPGTV